MKPLWKQGRIDQTGVGGGGGGGLEALAERLNLEYIYWDIFNCSLLSSSLVLALYSKDVLHFLYTLQKQNTSFNTSQKIIRIFNANFKFSTSLENYFKIVTFDKEPDVIRSVAKNIYLAFKLRTKFD